MTFGCSNSASPSDTSSGYTKSDSKDNSSNDNQNDSKDSKSQENNSTNNNQSKEATNTTTVALSSATLSAAYPTAITGFKVHALDIIAGGRIYEKTSTGWCEYLATITA